MSDVLELLIDRIDTPIGEMIIVADAVMASQEVVHARFMIGPIDGAQVSVAVGDDDHFADRGVDSIDSKFENINQVGISGLSCWWCRLPRGAGQRRRAKVARTRRG